MATPSPKIYQYYFFNKEKNNIRYDTLLDNICQGENIIQLGIQTLPGTVFYVGENNESTFIVNNTGIYEIELKDTNCISHLCFSKASIDTIIDNPTAFLIIDVQLETIPLNDNMGKGDEI